VGTSDFFQHFFCINRRHVRVDLSDDQKRDFVDAVTKLETFVLNFHNVSGSLLTLIVLKAWNLVTSLLSTLSFLLVVSVNQLAPPLLQNHGMICLFRDFSV